MSRRSRVSRETLDNTASGADTGIATLHMTEQGNYRSRCYAGNARSRPQCRWAGLPQLLPDLGGQAADGVNVQIVGQKQRLVLAEGADIGFLPVKITGVAGIDLQLFDNGGG